jgi:hypothetical protein
VSVGDEGRPDGDECDRGRDRRAQAARDAESGAAASFGGLDDLPHDLGGRELDGPEKQRPDDDVEEERGGGDRDRAEQREARPRRDTENGRAERGHEDGLREYVREEPTARQASGFVTELLHFERFDRARSERERAQKKAVSTELDDHEKECDGSGDGERQDLAVDGRGRDGWIEQEQPGNEEDEKRARGDREREERDDDARSELGRGGIHRALSAEASTIGGGTLLMKRAP